MGRPRKINSTAFENSRDGRANQQRIAILTIALLLVLWPASAHANAGMPMLMYVWPVFGYALIPVIAIEAWYLSKKLEVGRFAAGKTALFANIVSTVVGIPITWILLAILQTVTDPDGSAVPFDSIPGKIASVTWQAPVLVPHLGIENHFHWMKPAAGITLLIPFFFASWWSERLVARALFKDLPEKTISVAIRNANLITYAMLAVFSVGRLIYAIETH